MSKCPLPPALPEHFLGFVIDRLCWDALGLFSTLSAHGPFPFPVNQMRAFFLKRDVDPLIESHVVSLRPALQFVSLTPHFSSVHQRLGRS